LHLLLLFQLMPLLLLLLLVVVVVEPLPLLPRVTVGVERDRVALPFESGCAVRPAKARIHTLDGG
jgi:hypothetical protein